MESYSELVFKVWAQSGQLWPTCKFSV